MAVLDTEEQRKLKCTNAIEFFNRPSDLTFYFTDDPGRPISYEAFANHILQNVDDTKLNDFTLQYLAAVNNPDRAAVVEKMIKIFNRKDINEISRANKHVFEFL